MKYRKLLALVAFSSHNFTVTTTPGIDQTFHPFLTGDHLHCKRLGVTDVWSQIGSKIAGRGLSVACSLASLVSLVLAPSFLPSSQFQFRAEAGLTGRVRRGRELPRDTVEPGATRASNHQQQQSPHCRHDLWLHQPTDRK